MGETVITELNDQLSHECSILDKNQVDDFPSIEREKRWGILSSRGRF